MTAYFGEPWDAPMIADDPDAVHADTPVGVRCLECDEPIAADDQGLLRPFMHGRLWHRPEWIVAPLGEQASVTAVHRECDMLGIVGHMVGVCSCTDYAGFGVRGRAAAREVLARVAGGDLWPAEDPR